MCAKAVKPPGELNRYLVPQEHIVLVQRSHWVSIVGPVALPVGWLIVLGWLDSGTENQSRILIDAAMWIWYFLVLRAVWKLLDWRHDVFIATDRRLLNTYGLVTRKVAMMPLGKVTDMSYVRTAPGKILGYGTFRLESAGQDQALSTIKFVPHPDETYRTITTEIFKPPTRRATDVRPPPGSGSALPVVEPDDVWWRR